MRVLAQTENRRESLRCFPWLDLEPDTHREDAVVSGPEVAVRRHHTRQRVDVKALVVVILEPVRHCSVRAAVIVAGNHSVHFLFACPAPLLRYFDVEKFIGELWLVVVVIENSDHDGGGGTQRRGSVIRHDHLRTNRDILGKVPTILQ